MRKLTATATGALAAALLLLATPLAASADPDPDLQHRTDAVIEEFGGTQTGPGEVTWDGGAVVLTLAADDARGPGTLAVGSCPSGSYCAYSLAGYFGSRLTFTTCTTGNSVAPLGSPVRSIANSRTSGTVRAYNSGSLVLTVPANTGVNTIATITTLSCS